MASGRKIGGGVFPQRQAERVETAAEIYGSPGESAFLFKFFYFIWLFSGGSASDKIRDGVSVDPFSPKISKLFAIFF